MAAKSQNCNGFLFQKWVWGENAFFGCSSPAPRHEPRTTNQEPQMTNHELRTGLDWTELHWAGLDWNRRDWTGPAHPPA